MNRAIRKIIIHCSDSGRPQHNDIEIIRQWHTMPPPHGNGWRDVGYHFFIKTDGEIQTGRTLDQSGAHVRGHNEDSIGICLHGRNEFTQAQFNSLRQLMQSLYFEFGLTINDVYGHCDFDQNKTCPNFDYKKILSPGMFNDPKTEKRV